jgi:hypothetical protein
MESRARTQIGYFKTIRGREIAIIATIAIIAVIENLGERPSTRRNRGSRGTGEFH